MNDKFCERCGLFELDTPEGMLAYHGTRLVCADCDAALNDEWSAEEPGRVHPIDMLCPAAHFSARMARA